MTPKTRVIIDTDPGTDDVLAILLALTAPAEDLEVLLLSITYGNTTVEACLKNVITLFNVIHLESEWRNANGKPEGFPTLKAHPPLIAVGASHPLEEDELIADYFHGVDGLHGVHDEHPHLTPGETWRGLFDKDSKDPETALFHRNFKASKKLAHLEILRILRESPPETVSVVVIGPMTNVALAAAEDPETFLRAKEVIVMGGAIHIEGNVTPVAEFNTCADAIAAARIFALTSPKPESTMPPETKGGTSLSGYPVNLSSTLKLTLFPVDITTLHSLNKERFMSQIKPLIDAGSPLARWVHHFMAKAFDHIGATEESNGFDLHDPLTIWYLLTQDIPGWKLAPEPEDIRIETTGQWTRGMHVIDRRRLKKTTETPVLVAEAEDIGPGIPAADNGGWLSLSNGNRINRMVAAPDPELIPDAIVCSIFGLN